MAETKKNKVQCPACGREVALDMLGKTLDGDRLMHFHYENDSTRERQCSGSRNTVKATRTRAEGRNA